MITLLRALPKTWAHTPTALVFFTIGAGCARHTSAPPLPFTHALLAAGVQARDNTPALDEAAALTALAAVAADVRREFQAAGNVSASATLSRAVFEKLAFVREVEDQAPRFMRLDQVLASRRGSCVGLAALFLALGEWLGPELGFHVAGVLVPGHFFVRVSDAAGTHNVELLRRGENMPDAWYRQRYQMPPVSTPGYLRSLTPSEVLAVFAYNTGNHQRVQGHLGDAELSYAQAARAFPQMAEASASLGLVLQLQGRADEARRAYATARIANPGLPGLDANIALLDPQTRQTTSAHGSAPDPTGSRPPVDNAPPRRSP